MSRSRDNEPVTFWFWMLALLVMAIPCVGPVMIIVWAFTGTNESRKNYFKAVIAWFFIAGAIALAIASLGAWPVIEKEVTSRLPWNKEQPKEVNRPSHDHRHPAR